MQGGKSNADDACSNARMIRHFDLIDVMKNERSGSGSRWKVYK
jgi:hypothetical protein